MRVRSLCRLSLLAVIIVGSTVVPSARPPQAPAPQSAATPPLVAEFLAFDGSGRPVVDLHPSDISVSVDGKPRAVRGLHLVARGPGADAAAAAWAVRLAGSSTVAHADSARTILIAVDETSVPRGSEKPVQALVAGLIDLLGPADRTALARLPGPATRPEFVTSRDGVRAQLARVTGRAAPVDYLARLRDQAPASFTNDGDGPSQQQRLHDTARESGATGATPAAAAALPPLEVLTRLIASWRDEPGAHMVVVVGTGLVAGGTRESDIKPAIARCLEAAAASRTAIYALKPDGVTGPGDAAQMAQLALSSGGTAVGVGRNAAPDLQRLIRDWSSSYLVEFEEAGIGPGNVAPMAIAATRSGVRIRAAGSWSARRDPLPPRVAPPAPAPARAAATPARTAPGGTTATPRPGEPGESPAAFKKEPVTDSETIVTVARAVDYVAGYMRDLPTFVAEEDYEQNTERPQTGRYQNLDNARRRTRSDFLMVTAPGVSGWMPFRDVFEVDGKKLRDREDRLRKLFLEAGDASAAIRDARVISDESSRYNLGTVGRTINVPTLPLAFLTRERVGGLNLRRGSDETVEGVRAWRIDFEEWASPTLIRTDAKEDLPSSGTFWIDPLTGRVLKTALRTSPGGVRTESVVVYRRSDSLGFWMPAEMREQYSAGSEKIACKAVYTNYRRFQVNTEEIIKD